MRPETLLVLVLAALALATWAALVSTMQLFWWPVQTRRRLREQVRKVTRCMLDPHYLDDVTIAWGFVLIGRCPYCHGTGVDHETTLEQARLEEEELVPPKWEKGECHFCKGAGAIEEHEVRYWRWLLAQQRARKGKLEHPFEAGMCTPLPKHVVEAHQRWLETGEGDPWGGFFDGAEGDDVEGGQGA